MQQAAPIQPRPASHRGRNFGLGCAALIALVVVLVIVGSNASKNQTTLKWDVSGRSTTSSIVGGDDATQVTVTNNGSNASQLILDLNAKDDWFKHHMITDPDGCSINKDLERLECGPLAAGATRTINWWDHRKILATSTSSSTSQTRRARSCFTRIRAR